MSRASLLSSVLLLAFLTSACPGELDNPDRFQPVVSDTGGDSGGPDDECSLTITEIEQQILAQGCGLSGCHDPATRSADLDTVTADLGSRVLDQPAGACAGEVLVDSADPSRSYFLNKLTDEPICGSRMPFGSPLSAAEIDCLHDWAASLAPAP